MAVNTLIFPNKNSHSFKQFVINLGTGCTTDTPSYYRRPSFLNRSSKNMEQSAAVSDVIMNIVILQI